MMQKAAEEVPAILTIVECVLNVFMPDKVEITRSNELHARRLCQHREEAEVLNDCVLRPALLPAILFHKTFTEKCEVS
jgi:hypothetical protein